MITYKTLKKIWREAWAAATLLGKLIMLPAILILTLLIIPVTVCEVILLDIPYIILSVFDGWTIRQSWRYLNYL